MKDCPVTIVTERDRNVAVEVGEESYAIPEEIGALLIALGYKPSARENPVTSVTAAVLEADRKRRRS